MRLSEPISFSDVVPNKLYLYKFNMNGYENHTYIEIGVINKRYPKFFEGCGSCHGGDVEPEWILEIREIIDAN